MKNKSTFLSLSTAIDLHSLMSGVQTISGAAGSSKSLIAAEIFSTSKKSTLVVCENNTQADIAYKELKLFSPESDRNLIFIPDTETLPYDQETPHSGLISERAFAFNRLASERNKASIIVTSLPNLIRRTSSVSYWSDDHLKITVGDNLSVEDIKNRLIYLGYTEGETEIENFGEFSKRNNIIDIFPMGEMDPVRVRIENNAVKKIDIISVSTQKSTNKSLESIKALPAREMPIHPDAIEKFRVSYRRQFKRSIGHVIYESVLSGNIPNGIEYYLPLFQENVSTIFDYIPEGEDAVVIKIGDVDEAAKKLYEYIDNRYEDLGLSDERMLMPPEKLWLTPKELNEQFLSHPTIAISEDGNDFSRINGISRQATAADLMMLIGDEIEDIERVIFCLHSNVREEQTKFLSEMVFDDEMQTFSSWHEAISSNSPVSLVFGEVDKGFATYDKRLAVVTEKELYGQPIFAKDEREQNEGVSYESIGDLKSIQLGDPLVHVKHGVGRFAGLMAIPVQGVVREYMRIQYDEDAIAMVPMDELDSVSRYGGINTEVAPLDQMQSNKWKQGLEKAYRAIIENAKSIIDINNKRIKEIGHAFKKPGYHLTKFSRDFPFTETKDQRLAIEDIIKDMTSPTPMNRTIVGDVGFGKTEVAMRAAFIAANEGFDVALMVPTSLLSMQHFQSFSKRFEDYDIEVVHMNKSSCAADVLKFREPHSENKKGRIAVGTQRLLQDDMKYSKLGLFIIDEEHRFGAKDKQKISQFKKGIDSLSMTATPIPRTLSMSLHGVRDISIITTPPAKRLSIRTKVAKKDDSLYKEAIQRELMRNGQAFILHNVVSTIEQRTKEIQQIIPEARVRFAHGQMSEIEMESIMVAFYRHEFDVLVCTTIIETGIDVPNANTIIIEGVETLGIAQLHQLRGRVGRSNHQAYAYLVPSKSKIGDNTKKRLNALEKSNKLGDGFVLATHDLGIRGAGELLGEDQSGHIQNIGFTLYMRYLNKAMDILKNGGSISKIMSETYDIKVEMNVSALIPDDFIENEQARLSMYKRFASVETPTKLVEIQEEIEDRFGKPPEETRNIIDISKLRAFLRSIGVIKLTIADDQGIMIFKDQSQIHKYHIDQMIENDPDVFSNPEPLKIAFRANTSGKEDRFEFIIDMMKKMMEGY